MIGLCLIALLCSLRGCNSGVYFEVDFDTILSINGVTTSGQVFGLTAYGNGKVEDFATPEGVEYLKQWNVDFIGFGNELGAILPSSHKSLSVHELKLWLSSSKASELFKSTATYAVLKSQGIRKAGSQQLLFLRDLSCVPYSASLECYKNLTPRPLNGSSSMDNFEWWATLLTSFYKLCVETDPDANLLHIWNEPNTYFYHDGKNGSYFAEFYVAIASSIKKEFPYAVIGGPVLEDDPIGPTRPNSSFSTWEDYSKTLIDAAVPKGLLDYFDFHAYSNKVNNTKTLSQPLLGGLSTVDAYSYVKYGVHLTSAITESNIKIFNTTEAYTRSSHFNIRTFPLILSTVALLKNPDKIKTRMIFDYKSPGQHCNCQFDGYPNSTNSITPEMETYYLLGKLRDGTRLFVDVPTVNVPENCICLPGQSIQYGNSSVLVEAVYSKGNLTVAIVNMCECSLQLNAWVKGIDSNQFVSSWGAILDVQSLREVVAPEPPYLTMSLPSTSLVTLSYTLKISQHVAMNTVSFIHFYPKTSEEIMLSIPLDTQCNNTSLNISYDLSSSNSDNAKEALVRFGVLGPAGNYTWSITTICIGGIPNKQDVYAPAAYSEVRLPCVPDTDNNGVTNIQFTVVDCDKKISFTTSTPKAFFEFSVLVLRY